MAVRCIDDNDIATRVEQRFRAFSSIVANASRRRDPQAVAAIRKAARGEDDEVEAVEEEEEEARPRRRSAKAPAAAAATAMEVVEEEEEEEEVRPRSVSFTLVRDSKPEEEDKAAQAAIQW